MQIDILRYQIGSIQFPHPYLEGAKIPAPAPFIFQQTQKILDRIFEVVGPDDFRMLFTGPDNFRFDIATEQPYKGNRKDFAKPYHWITVHDYIFNKYGRKVVTCVGFEADDFMAFQRFRDEPDKEYYICTRDKDLDTVPGWHYRWACGENQPERLPYWITLFEAHQFLLTQCLMGDNTDNICGCGRKEEVMWGGKPMLRRKGIGPKAAVKLLKEGQTIGEMLEIVRDAYKDRFPGEDWEAILLENARLLYMGQRPNKLFDWSWLDSDLELEKEMKIDLINSHPDDLEGGVERMTKPRKHVVSELNERTSQEIRSKESNKTIRSNRKAKQTNKEVTDNE